MQLKIKKQLKETGLFLLDILYNAIIIVILVVVIKSFLISPFRVVGSSMVDTLHNKDYLLINKLGYIIGDVEQGDVIVFKPPATNSDSPKFEEVIKTDNGGMGRLELDELRVGSDSAYCQNGFTGMFWFCKEKPEENDLVYYAPQAVQPGSDTFETDWEAVDRVDLSKEALKQGYLEIEGAANTNYTLRIYNSMGPEYFVKRVIGTPGDTVKIEEGMVYVKNANEVAFKQIDESFLNEDNFGKTVITEIGRENVYEVPEGHYFVMGDNRTHSNDSRSWNEPITGDSFAFVPEENIDGKVMIALWPFSDIRFIKSADF